MTQLGDLRPVEPLCRLRLVRGRRSVMHCVDKRGGVVEAFRSTVSTWRLPARSRRSGTRSIPMTVFAPRGRAIRHAMSPMGSSPTTATLPPSEMAAYSTACQAVGNTSER